MTSSNFDAVLCFGDSDWWYHNRGHADMQFMRRFARHWPVVYVNSLGVKMPSVSEGGMFARRVARKVRSMTRYYRDGGEGFGVLSPLFAPVGNGILGRGLVRGLAMQIRALLRLRGIRRPLIWVACPTAACVLDRIPSGGVVYQLSDYYVGLQTGHSSRAAQMERLIATSADLVICSSGRLFDRARELYDKGEYVDHGVDFALFDQAVRIPKVPGELRGVEHPIIGFYGNIDGNTVDGGLLERVILLRPQYRFVLVGSMASEFEPLRRHPNVVAVGQKAYRDIPHYGAAFDVCLMPWLQNDWIEHCNPVKLKEYLALGKPVVSTPFAELKRVRGLCYEAAGAEPFAMAIDRALIEDNEELRSKRRSWAAQHTWDAQFSRVMELLEERGIHANGATTPHG